MAARKKQTVNEFFEKNNNLIIRFGERFVKMLADDELIESYAVKDLEKLAKVWKLVLDMLSDNTKANNAGRLAELIGEYNDADGESGEER